MLLISPPSIHPVYIDSRKVSTVPRVPAGPTNHLDSSKWRGYATGLLNLTDNMTSVVTRAVSLISKKTDSNLQVGPY